MGYVRLKKSLNKDVAQLFGGKATRPYGERCLAKARALANARAKHSSVAGDIDLSLHGHGTHTAVIMSVQGRHADGSPSGEVASHLEFGAYNTWAGRWIPGKHIMRDARASL